MCIHAFSFANRYSKFFFHKSKTSIPDTLALLAQLIKSDPFPEFEGESMKKLIPVTQGVVDDVNWEVRRI
jgi:hypothetical protein